MENKVEIRIIAKDLASKAIQGLNSTVSSVTSKLSGMAKTIGGKVLDGIQQLKYAALATGAALGYMGMRIAKAAIQTTADLESMRMGFVTLLGSTEKADDALKRIKKDAAKTPFEIKGLIQANQLLTSVTKDADRSEDLLMDVGKALAAMGRGQPELDRIIINLQQIGAVGRASTLDLKQFAFAGIPIFDMLKESTGLAGKALEDFITEGNVTFEMLEEMFAKAGTGSGQFAKAFETQVGTLNQLISNLKDNFVILGSEILIQTGLFDLVKNAVSRFTNFLTNNSAVIITFVQEGLETLKAKLIELNQTWGIQEKVERFINFIRENQTNVVDFAKNFGLVTVAVLALSVAIGIITSPITVFLGLMALISAALTVWQNDIWGVKTKTEEAINKVKEVFTALMQNPAVQWFINKAKELAGQIKDNLYNVVEALRGAFERLSPKISELVRNVAPLVAALGGALLLAAMKIGEYLSRILPPAIQVASFAFGIILDMINMNINNFKTLYSWVVKVVNKLKEFKDKARNSSVGKFLGIANNASGTSFYGGGATMVGERGPELVQLPRGSRINSASETRNMTTSPITNNITINGYNKNPQELAQVIIRELARRNQAQSLGLNLGY